MPIIHPENRALKELTGIHLWHAEMSSCSQRVRIALAEKNLNFESYLIDLSLGEHATPEYQTIHPKGVVPAMVINGELVIESVDIIDEIDKRYPGENLRPLNPAASKLMDNIMARADKAQSTLKLLTFEFLFTAAPPPPKEVSDAIMRDHRNEGLKAFKKEFKAGFSRERIRRGVTEAHEDFEMLDKLLSDGRPYLAGESYSLADVAWIPNFHRFDLIKWPYENYPHLQLWFGRVSARPSYQTGLVDWEPKGFAERVAPKIQLRYDAGDGVNAYIP